MSLVCVENLHGYILVPLKPLKQVGQLRIFEDECLGIHEFCSYGHAYAEVAKFIKRYNTKRLHSSLKYKAPEIFYELNKGKEIESMAIHL